MISRKPEEYIGKVIEIEAQSQLASGKFEHGQFVRFREDKSDEECVL
jgi:ATP-dependent DNA ligase